MSKEKDTKKQEVLSPGKIAWRKFRKNRLAIFGAIVLTIMVLATVFANFLAPCDPNALDIFNCTKAPDSNHLLGTDDVGRDVLSRLLYGGRVSLTVGFAAVVLELLIGVTLGAFAGYFGGVVDACISRVVDMVMCFPFYVIAVSMAAILGASARNIVIIIAVLSWPGISRIVRAQVMALRNREFIEAARALGLTPAEIIFKHMLPNCLSPIIVNATLSMASAILTEAGLSFIGMGVSLPTPSWGNMLSAAQEMTALQHHWWRWLPPGLCVFLTVLSINFVGDGLRDALDPRVKSKS